MSNSPSCSPKSGTRPIGDYVQKIPAIRTNDDAFVEEESDEVRFAVFRLVEIYDVRIQIELNLKVEIFDALS